MTGIRVAAALAILLGAGGLALVVHDSPTVQRSTRHSVHARGTPRPTPAPRLIVLQGVVAHLDTATNDVVLRVGGLIYVVRVTSATATIGPCTESALLRPGRWIDVSLDAYPHGELMARAIGPAAARANDHCAATAVRSHTP